MKKLMLPQQSAPVERQLNYSSANLSASAVIAQGAGGGRGIPKGAPFAEVGASGAGGGRGIPKGAPFADICASGAGGGRGIPKGAPFAEVCASSIIFSPVPFASDDAE